MHPKEPESFIDRIQKFLEKKGMPANLYRVSDGNQIRLIDTPRVWGAEMNEKGVSAAAAEAVAALAGEIEQMLTDAVHTIDIVTLDAPKGLFVEAIHNGLKAHADRTEPLLVRLLFGLVPFEGSVERFLDDLADFRSRHLRNDKVTILAGQYYCLKPYSMSWNHAKIVAVDGRTAIVGGHNLWSDAYGNYPPVHDVSVQVVGQAATDAHRFAEFMWANAGDLMATWHITPGGKKKRTIDSKTSVGDGIVKRKDEHPVKEDDKGAKSPLSRHEGWRPGRVMALGRAGVLQDSSFNASDFAKQLIIKNAKRSLRICQQDLLFLSSASIEEHEVCHCIAEALLDRDELEVQIVVSPIDGSGAGAQYSWGSGAIGTYQALAKLVQAKAESKEQASRALERLSVAPFCFTGVRFRAEGRDYQWPKVPTSLQAFRFDPTVSLLRQNPFNKKPPAPGNHAKFYLADDRVYYVGSDNLYPHNLAEFGYLVEGDSVADVLKNYWNHVWYYSSPHCVTEETIRTHQKYDEIVARERMVAQRNKEISEKVDELHEL